MGRLKAGVTLEQANANMDAVSRNIARDHPASASGWSASVEPFRNNFLSDDTKRGLWLLLGAVGFLLLIACANVANLLLARGTARRRELAVRASLGASRAQIIGQLLVESLVLALIGVALAAGLLAGGSTDASVHASDRGRRPPQRSGAAVHAGGLRDRGHALRLGARLAAARADVNDTLKESGRSLSGGGNRLRHALVVVEFALALALLTGGGLAIHSLFTLANRDLGFRTEGLLTFSLSVAEDRFESPEEIAAFYRQVVEHLEAVPGVLSASVSTGMPVRGVNIGMQFDRATRPEPDVGKRPGAGFNMVTPEYFETFGIRLTRGRAFTDQDRAGAVPVAIVNETFVRQYLADIDPLTERLSILKLTAGVQQLGPAVEWQIVGVYRDVRNAGPGRDGFPEIVVPFWQSPWPDAGVAIRTAGDPTTLQQPLAAVVQSIDPDLPMAGVRTMKQMVAESLVTDRFNTLLFGSFAAVGLLLAAFGIYGVMSFVVAQRTHEIGLRMALGAERSHIIRHVMREGLVSAGIGAVVGSAGAYFVAKTMRGIVAGIGEGDWTAFVIVLSTLVVTAVVACLAPAARAASVGPMVALREE